MNTKRTLTPLILTAASLLSAEAFSGGHSDLEKRVAELEAKQSDVWYNALTIGGVIEVETSYEDPDGGDSSSDIVVSTAELGIEAEVTDNIGTNLVFLYEEGDSVDVDVATINYTHGDSGFSVIAGQEYLPFGSYSTALVNDPLGLEIGEIRETAFIAEYAVGGFTTAFYLFNGRQDEDGKDDINNFGARVHYANDVFAVGFDYLSNFADTDGLQGEDDDNPNDYGDKVAGYSVHGEVNLGAVQLFAEHVAAADKLENDGNDSEPSATQFEVALNAGDFTYAVAYQQTDEAEFADLPEERISLGLSTEILGGLGLGFELTSDEAYDGSDSNSAVLLLSAEF